MSVSNPIWIVIVSLILTQWHTSAELYTSISAIAPLLDTHKRMIDDLEAVIIHQEKLLDFFKSQLNIYKVEQEKAANDTINYLENPINAFTLIKRLTVNKLYMKHIIKSNLDIIIKEISAKHTDFRYPDEEDLTGAAQALLRLKDTYNLNINELAEGVLNGVSYGSPMTSNDCFEMGNIFYNLEKYEEALPWMLEAYYKSDIQDDSFQISNRISIVEYIVYINYLLGDFYGVAEWMDILNKVDPESKTRKTNASYLETSINKRIETLRNLMEVDVLQLEYESSEDIESMEKDTLKMFDSLCRGENKVPQEISSKLKCRYFTESNLALLIGPFKVEQVYVNPEILIFYDVLMDEEIDGIIELSKSKMERAATVGGITEYRTSQVAWLDEQSEVTARVARRVQLMTGLNLETAEDFQVVNYGIGGHYGPHWDVNTTKDQDPFEYPGERLATVLFYMSDVAQGGSTVFPNLGIGVSPSKGTAVVWYNLHHSGAVDLATLHGSCPVLIGSKWITTKWLYEGGQEFIKPCNLEYQPKDRADV